jgi:hypothetical protein
VLGIMFVWLAIATPSSAQPSGPNGNLPVPPEILQRRLEHEPFEITAVEETKGGVMGAQKLAVVFPSDGFTTNVKWKAADDGGEGWNNAPRREIAAYKVQQLFLDPDDYVVPPVAVRCIALGDYGPIDKNPSPNVDDAQCVLGVVSAWLQNVTQPEEALDRTRYSTDPSYCYAFGNLNLLTYVIAHRDARSANMLVSTVPGDPRVFSVDNGISFGGVLYNFFTWHFDRIVVGGLPKRATERLNRVTRADLARFGVVAELRADEHGVLQAVEPGPNVDPENGERDLPDGIEFGLTSREIDEMWERIQTLRGWIASGAVLTF